MPHRHPLQAIPGVGPSIAADLVGIGINQVADLKNQDPQDLYQRVCRQQGQVIDRCLLYVFRCAVYYASTPHPDPAKLQWWWWQDKNLAARTAAGTQKP